MKTSQEESLYGRMQEGKLNRSVKRQLQKTTSNSQSSSALYQDRKHLKKVTENDLETNEQESKENYPHLASKEVGKRKETAISRKQIQDQQLQQI